MKYKIILKSVLGLLFYTSFVLIVAGCEHTPVPVTERQIKLLPLSGPVAESRAELSGLAWYGNNLILLPQYPDRFGNTLFTLTAQQLLNTLESNQTIPLQPAAIPLDDAGIPQEIADFEGFESIVFINDTVFMTIEAKGQNQTES